MALSNPIENRHSNVGINQSGEDNVSVDIVQSTDDTPYFWPVTPERYQEILATYQKDVDKLYTVKWGTHNLMDKIIQGMADDEGSIHEEDMTLVRNEVRGKVKEAARSIKQTFVPLFGDLFELTLQEIGSVPEGTKVGRINEFDTLFVVRPNSLRRSFRLHRDSSPQTENYKPQTYCQVELTDLNGVDDSFHANGFLQPQTIFDTFKRCISHHFTGAMVTQRGPAVNVYYRIPGLPSIGKIDMCFALEIPRYAITEYLEAHQSSLNNTDGLESPYHVICSGGFWKMSTCCAERDYIRDNLDPYYHNLYRCLKVRTWHLVIIIILYIILHQY